MDVLRRELLHTVKCKDHGVTILPFRQRIPSAYHITTITTSQSKVRGP